VSQPTGMTTWSWSMARSSVPEARRAQTESPRRDARARHRPELADGHGQTQRGGFLAYIAPRAIPGIGRRRRRRVSLGIHPARARRPNPVHMDRSGRRRRSTWISARASQESARARNRCRRVATSHPERCVGRSPGHRARSAQTAPMKTTTTRQRPRPKVREGFWPVRGVQMDRACGSSWCRQ
jgi:hypothetical protein